MSAPNITVTPEKFQLVLDVNDDIAVSITNVGFEAVMYRLLTTAPERYVVKHTKGVVKGNSTAKIAITLNPKHVREAVEQQAGGTRVIKDDFRLEYALQGADDVIEPRASNVPQLIKDKKAADPSSVHRKMLRCHVLLDAADAASTVTDPKSTSPARGEAANRMSAKEMEERTLREKNRRQESTPAASGSHSPIAAGQGNGRAGAVTSSKNDTTRRIQAILVIVAILAAGGIWLLME